MTPSLLIRPVLACAAAAALSGCGMVEADPQRFESMAEAIADIPLDGQARTAPARPPVVRTAADAGLRPALKVQVMDPHALWDARDGGLGGVAAEQGQRIAVAAAPAVAEAVVRDVSTRIDTAVVRTGLRPAKPARPAAPPRAGSLVQIGAYSSEAAAKAAWSRLKSGGAASALEGLTPVFEGVEVGGRRLTRLKVHAPAAGAAAVCAAAGVDDPWCHRAV
ncbi:MAG: SPOR domain-containing protein [Alphaproteobacteria bacterium]|nr:SPOR domain-containing protein [Alphaproteobacteria bacterium]MBU2272421.1 SPOR domain-containing protein [Alphaproteobacteria bacterium]MBU2418233.1 SPOR domain-containing protein [Alphaproteobacteria bacterium]